MSALAHATMGAAGPKLQAEQRALHNHIQHEIREAKGIQRQLGCSWTEALRLAYRPEQGALPCSTLSKP